ncbi:MAG TPA: hypothetical protein VII44_10680 [Puia sp.]
MKTNPSHYVLVVEVLIIILFHAVKIRQNEKHLADTAFTPINKTMNLPKPGIVNKSSIEYMLVNLVK